MIQATNRSPALSRQAQLVAAALPSGGWPYYSGKGARIEPTCWALLALGGATSTEAVRATTGAASFLRSLQHDDGLLVEPGTSAPNYGWNALALLALAGEPIAGTAELAGKIATRMLDVKGIKLPANPVIKVNTALQAWSWTPATFSWVEPTAYALLALKRFGATGPATGSRIADAEAVILDRVCESGGWNYGNSQVLSQDLRPYVPTSALALLTLQHRGDHPAVVKSLEWLGTHATTERSAMALALAAICLHVYKRPIDAVLKALSDERARTGLIGNVHLLAMATYALALPGRGARAFTY